MIIQSKSFSKFKALKSSPPRPPLLHLLLLWLGHLPARATWNNDCESHWCWSIPFNSWACSMNASVCFSASLLMGSWGVPAFVFLLLWTKLLCSHVCSLYVLCVCKYSVFWHNCALAELQNVGRANTYYTASLISTVMNTWYTRYNWQDHWPYPCLASCLVFSVCVQFPMSSYIENHTTQSQLKWRRFHPSGASLLFL